MFSFFLALKYLKPKRGVASVITLLSILGVMIGVAIVIIVRAVFTGFGDTWQKKILDFKPHVVVRSAYNEPLLQVDKLCEAYDAVPGVVASSPSIETRVLVEHRRRILAPVLLGVDSERIQKLLPLKAEDLQGAFDLEGDSVVVGVDMAEQLRLRVGSELLVYSPMNLIDKDEIYLPERLRVTGIFEMGHAEFDSGYIFVSLPLARDLAGVSYGANSISIKVEDPHAVKPPDPRQIVVAQDVDTSDVYQAIQQASQKVLGYGHVKLHTWQQLDRMIFAAVATEKNMMTLLLIFISIVAIFCVVNTIIVVTVQKTNEIGLLKSLGFSTWQLTATFVLYGWIQCILGTVLGIGLAFLVLNNLQNIVDLLGRFGLDVFPKAVYGLDALPWRVIPSEILQVVVMVVVFCAVASFLPAWRASAMNPVDALRKE